MRALPGVRTAAMAISVPIGVGGSGSRVYIEGRGDQNLLFQSNNVSSDYFTTMGTPIVKGRGSREDDTRDSRCVVIVSEVLAERLWPGQEPLGKRISTEGPRPGSRRGARAGWIPSRRCATSNRQAGRPLRGRHPAADPALTALRRGSMSRR